MSRLVSYLVITYNRHDDVRECISTILDQDYPHKEIIVEDNGSDPPIEPFLHETLGRLAVVKVLRSEINLGVSGGRNLGLDHTTGDIIITIDDDALIKDPQLTTKVIKKFDAEPEIGVLAFRITTFQTGEIEAASFPSKNKRRSPDEEFETTWFIGCGHAARRDVYEKAGNYLDYSPYGHEDIDLSLKVINAGYKIVYFPDAEVFHKKSPTSRILNPTKFFANQLANRVKVAIRNLPWRYVITTGIIRSGQALIRSRFNLIAITWAYFRILYGLPQSLRERQLISKDAVSKIVKLKGPALY
ncbi:MAG: glycosyltransferase [Fidelibacterota bacterium]|nr:MAG: glycosyltransferase [Candidatus Neomarinimicrobiota bacterium]